MSPRTPSEKRHARTRQAIINAARAILLKDGIDALSMRSLAEKVDYSPAALYKYFDSKEKILDALREEGWQRSAEMQRTALDPRAPIIEQLYTSGSVYLQFARQYPELYHLMFNVSESGPQQSLSEITADPNFAGLSNLVRQGVENGELELPPGTTPESLRWQAWFMTHGIAMLRMTLMRNCQEEFDEVALQVLRAQIESFKKTK